MAGSKHGNYFKMVNPGYSGNSLVSARISSRTLALTVLSPFDLRTRAIPLAITFISDSFIPRLVMAGVPNRIPEGLKGVELGEYPKGLAALLRNQYSVQDLVVEAVLKNSKQLVLEALLADPVIETHWQAKNILERMLEVQADYLKLE